MSYLRLEVDEADLARHRGHAIMYTGPLWCRTCGVEIAERWIEREGEPPDQKSRLDQLLSAWGGEAPPEVRKRAIKMINPEAFGTITILSDEDP